MISSTQVAGLVGGQQVMFANQAAFAHQISGQIGMGPAGQGGAQQAPPPQMQPLPSYGWGWGAPGAGDAGTHIAGGMAASIPSIAGGISAVGGLMGGAAGWLDPFTGTARGFARGAGFGGMGFMDTAAGIGNTFASGGARAGLGALAGGIGAGIATAGIYYAAGKGIQEVASGLYGGVQNIQDVGRMSHQYMAPDFTQAGQTISGGPSRGVVKGITSFLHELASEDVMTSMADMRRLMDQAGQAGMLGGAHNLEQFKAKFRGLVEQSKNIAKILGTTIDEAMPLVSQMNQMGLWTARDVMGTTMAMKSMGPQAAGAMLGSMQQGAMMSRSMGGSMRAGAMLGGELFQNVSSAMKTGTLNEEQLMDFTGGTGGVEGQRQVAGSMQQLMIKLSQSALGQVMVAGLGETENGKFTGRIDHKKMEMMMKGELTPAQVISMGRQNTSTKESKMSFMNKREGLSQEMIAQGGLAMGGEMFSMIANKIGMGDNEDAVEIIAKTIGGADTRTAEMAKQLLGNFGRDSMQRKRDLAASAEATIRTNEYRRNRSWEGLKNAISHAYEETVKSPLNRVMEEFTTNLSESIDTVTDTIMGRTRPMAQFGGKELMQSIRRGDFGKAGTMGSLGVHEDYQEWMTGEGYGWDQGWTDKQMMTRRGAMLMQQGIPTSTTGDIPLGLQGGAEVRVTTEALQKWNAMNAALSAGGKDAGLDIGKKGTVTYKAREDVTAALRQAISGPDAAELMKLHDRDPDAWSQKILEKLKSSGAKGDLDKLTGNDASKELQALQAVINHAGWGNSSELTVRSSALKEAMSGGLYGTAADKAFNEGLDALTRSATPDTMMMGKFGVVNQEQTGAGMTKEEASNLMGTMGTDVALAAAGGEKGAAAWKNLTAAAAGGNAAAKKFIERYFNKEGKFTGSQQDVERFGMTAKIAAARKGDIIEKEIGKEAAGEIQKVHEEMSLKDLQSLVASGSIGKLGAREWKKIEEGMKGGILSKEGIEEARGALGSKAYGQKAAKEETVKGGMEAALSKYEAGNGVLRVIDVTGQTQQQVADSLKDMQAATGKQDTTQPTHP